MKIGSIMTVDRVCDEAEEMYVNEALEAFQYDYLVQVTGVDGYEVTVYCPQLNCTFNVHESSLEPAELNRITSELSSWKWMVEPILSFELAVGEHAPELEAPKLLSIDDRKSVKDREYPIDEDEDE